MASSTPIMKGKSMKRKKPQVKKKGNILESSSSTDESLNLFSSPHPPAFKKMKEDPLIKGWNMIVEKEVDLYEKRLDVMDLLRPNLEPLMSFIVKMLLEDMEGKTVQANRNFMDLKQLFQAMAKNGLKNL